LGNGVTGVPFCAGGAELAAAEQSFLKPVS